MQYACKTWVTTQEEEFKLLTFEREVLQKMHRPVRNQIRRDEWRRRR